MKRLYSLLFLSLLWWHLPGSEAAIVSALTHGNTEAVTVEFSGDVNLPEALQPSSYSIHNGTAAVPISRVELINARTVRLYAPLPEGFAYRLLAPEVFTEALPVEVDPLKPSSLNLEPNSTTFVQAHGVILRSRWNGVVSSIFYQTMDRVLLGGADPSEATNWFGFLQTPPESATFATHLELPQNFGDGFGIAFQGHLTPPTNGLYVFFLNSDDQGALFLSTDESPENKELIAVEPWFSPHRSYKNPSIPVSLEGGKKYYVEAVTLNAVGAQGNSFSVTWMIPGNRPPIPSTAWYGLLPEPVPGEEPIGPGYLSALGYKTGPIQIVSGPTAKSVRVYESVFWRVEVEGTPPYQFQWYRNGEPLAGATTPDLNFPATPEDDQARYHVRASNGFSSADSAEVILTVRGAKAPLTIQKEGDDLLVSWPEEAKGFSLQWTAQFEEWTVWDTVPGSSDVTSIRFSPDLLPESPTLFWRLVF